MSAVARGRTEAADGALAVLAASQENHVLHLVAGALATSGDRFLPTTDVPEALAIASAEKPAVAFVDLLLDGGAGLALVHHLVTAHPDVAVYGLAPEADLQLGTQAVALGAVGFLPSPPSGDALLQAVGEVRARRAARDDRARLEAELAAAKCRNRLTDRVVQLANGGAHSEVARAIMEALAEVSDARGAALYAAFEPPPNGECVRLAAMGTAQDLASNTGGGDLLRVAAERGATVVPLGVAERLLALAVLEGGDPAREKDTAAIASVAATVLAFVDAGDGRTLPTASAAERAGRSAEGGEPRARVYPFDYFQDLAGREIDKAKRHTRRVAIAAILLDDGDAARSASRPPPADPITKTRAEIAPVVLGGVRDTDVLARFDDKELYLLLPETGALGAHACRRRLLLRAEGDRRSRAPQSTRRGPISNRPGRGVPLAIGVASYPHDGATLDRLLRAARQRASDAARSVVHALGLAPMSLAEIIDVLLARPMMGASFGAPYPLDLVAPAMLSLVGAACREARRSGPASILVTSRAGMGMASAARPADAGAAAAGTVHLADVRGAPRCENAEAIVVNAEHGSWVCCGRRDENRFRGVHAADPVLADLIAQRLAQASGIRWP
jgi:ActR/RegA family two-component response regulator/GGDEF domain-containing protein